MPTPCACRSSAVPAGASCPEAGATLVVTVQTRVALPLVPPVLGLDRLASIPIEASAVQKVSRFWESRVSVRVAVRRRATGHDDRRTTRAAS